VQVETSCTAIGGVATDCLCQAGEVAVSGGAFSGAMSNMLNALQAGPSYGGTAETWRVSCVQPTSGARVNCTSPFAVCLGGPGAAAVHVESSCTAVPGIAEDCVCQAGEVAISGGAFTAGLGNMLNASQVGPSYGGTAQTWRVSCVDPTGTRVSCAQPFAVCLAAPYSSAVRVETMHCAEVTADHAVDCTCNTNEVAISGGTFTAGTGNMINASQAGPSYAGGTAQTWRVSCVDPTGTRVSCAMPFAVCATSGI
jgi:hypothetical protein